MFKRRKDYIVTIIAENMVYNVLLGTDLFDFKNKCDYQLKIRRKRWGDK